MRGTTTLIRIAAGFALMVALAPCGLAQYVVPKKTPPQRPTISPYINLLRPGNSVASNYVHLVRPELELRSQLAQQNSAINQLNTQVQSQSAAIAEQATGHTTSFLSYSSYYPGLAHGATHHSSAHGTTRPAASGHPSTAVHHPH